MSDDYEDIQQRQYELIQEITDLAAELGWTFGIPQSEEPNTLVNGIIIGTSDFISDIAVKSGSNIEVIESEEETVSTLKKVMH